MKKLITFTFLIFLICSQSVFSQDDKFLDAPFGGGGGYSPGWYMPNLDAVNSKLKAFGVPALSTSGFYTSGGAGFIYFGFIPYLRIGGMGFGGSTSESAVISGIDGINREAIYSLGGGGVTIEYTMPFIKNFGVSVGAIIGGASLQIDLYRNSGSFNWDGTWNEITNNSTQNISRSIKNSFWFFAPTLNIDIPAYRFITFRVGAGYQLALSNNWTIENDKELTGVPSDLNGDSFFIQTGIFIGFFSY